MHATEHPPAGPGDRLLSWAHRGFALLAAVVALVALAGWMAGVSELTRFLQDRPALSVMTAAVMLVGVVAAMVAPFRAPAVWLPGLVEGAAGAAIVACHALDLTAASGIPPAFWSSPFTGMLFVLSGAAAGAIGAGRIATGQALAMAVLSFALLFGFGHLMPDSQIYAHLPGTGVSIPTVVGFVGLAMSTLLACRHGGIVAALSSQGAAGRPGFRLLVAGTGCTLAAAYFVLDGYRQGRLDAESALVVAIWCGLVTLVGTLWGLAVAVNRAESARVAADAEHARTRRTIEASITHDLRSPLHTATLAANLLARQVEDPRARASVERLQHSHRRLDRMLRSMLDDLTAGHGGMPTFRMASFGMRALVQEVVAENAAVLGDSVAVHGDADGWWDRDALFRVLENLLLNARKYGGPDARIDCDILPAAPPQQPDVRVRVANTGPPIPEVEWETIFAAFARGHAAESGGRAGWGVGLAFCRLVATAHRGSLRVLRSDSTQTVFELVLPVDARSGR